MSNYATWIGNIDGASRPLIVAGDVFQAGGTLAIQAGDILSWDGTTWTLLDADEAMAGDVAIAACDIADGDRAGIYPIIAPRQGDIFEMALDAAGIWGNRTALYYSAKNTLTETTGSNILGYVWGDDQYPAFMPRGSEGQTGNPGVTLKSKSKVQFRFKWSVSYAFMD